MKSILVLIRQKGLFATKYTFDTKIIWWQHCSKPQNTNLCQRQVTIPPALPASPPQNHKHRPLIAVPALPTNMFIITYRNQHLININCRRNDGLTYNCTSSAGTSEVMSSMFYPLLGRLSSPASSGRLKSQMSGSWSEGDVVEFRCRAKPAAGGVWCDVCHPGKSDTTVEERGTGGEM